MITPTIDVLLSITRFRHGAQLSVSRTWVSAHCTLNKTIFVGGVFINFNILDVHSIASGRIAQIFTSLKV